MKNGVFYFGISPLVFKILIKVFAQKLHDDITNKILDGFCSNSVQLHVLQYLLIIKNFV